MKTNNKMDFIKTFMGLTFAGLLILAITGGIVSLIIYHPRIFGILAFFFAIFWAAFEIYDGGEYNEQ